MLSKFTGTSIANERPPDDKAQCDWIMDLEYAYFSLIVDGFHGHYLWLAVLGFAVVYVFPVRIVKDTFLPFFLNDVFQSTVFWPFVVENLQTFLFFFAFVFPDLRNVLLMIEEANYQPPPLTHEQMQASLETDFNSGSLYGLITSKV